MRRAGEVVEETGGYATDQLNNMDLDEVIAVPEADAFATARRAAREEGVFSGPCTGANVAAALRLARRLDAGRRVVPCRSIRD